MFHTAMTFQLKPGCYDEYKHAHDNLWPDIAKSMSDNDVSMVVYHHHGRLFLFAAAPDEAHWQRSRVHPALEKWHEYMATLMVTGDDGHTIVEELDEAFVFGMFK